ncbi:protein Jade-1 isoform X3 [Alosa alosa]|uniref:protein Jade-1 isoform X3 n=1 Tax=Alosa alosa TaxID=278164 RepID=UPI0020150AFC|nr:protein Jade-1 isoform X3 [Alosa alosa]XP_048098997.1 protein Jade-1 isoform X3 [Alosa alosa]
MKRNRHPSSSDDSDTGSTSTSWSQHSKSQTRRSKGKKPSEVFRTDLITAMKLHDSYQLNAEDYYVLADPWRQEWEKGVQVPVSPNSIPGPAVCTVAERPSAVMFSRPKKMIRSSGLEPPVLGYVPIRTLAEGVCRYDLDEEDVAWLHYANKEFGLMGTQPMDELTMERVMEEFERSCYDNLSHAMETEEGLGIEYDEDVVCDVCQSPDGEDGNEMVFCDKCNICVHQACYGILKVPEGSWLCRICALGILPRCQLCPKKGGAMKPTRSGTKWVHVSCALWVPEVSIGNPEKMEPITNISHIPSNRWALSCCLCKERSGACIQCSAKSCRTAFHVTCGQHAGLKMSTILTESDEVKFKSFCPLHSGLKTAAEEEEGAPDAVTVKEEREEDSGRRSSRKVRERPAADGVRVSERKQRLQQLEDDFFRFVSVGDVAKRLGLPADTVDFAFQYWKLKRRVNFNRPLVTPKREEEESLARREQEVLLRRLRLFTHLRQDLERVRNLTYMVTRREKIKRSVCRVQEQIFQQHIKLLEQGRFTGLSTTRRLSEAWFYFRDAPSVPYPSPRALKGHPALNTPLAPGSSAPTGPPSSPAWRGPLQSPAAREPLQASQDQRLSSSQDAAAQRRASVPADAGQRPPAGQGCQGDGRRLRPGAGGHSSGHSGRRHQGGHGKASRRASGEEGERHRGLHGNVRARRGAGPPPHAPQPQPHPQADPSGHPPPRPDLQHGGPQETTTGTVAAGPTQTPNRVQALSGHATEAG